MICALSENELQENLRLWEKELMKRNLNVNANKIKVVMIGNEKQDIKNRSKRTYNGTGGNI